MTSHTLKLSHPGVVSSGCGDYLELVGQKPDGTQNFKSKISVRVYFLYKEAGQKNPDVQYVRVVQTTNAGNAGGNRGGGQKRARNER